MNVRFDDKRALVTGAGKGIGRALAIALMKGGADTYALSRTQSDLDSLKKEVPGIKTILCDVSDWDHTKCVVQGIIKSGPIDLLVNNAGVYDFEVVGEITKEEALKTMVTNLLAPMNVAQEVARGLKDVARRGSIVNVSGVWSMIANFPMKGGCTYAASKGGLDAMTRVMAMELGPHNIRVNSINPTAVLTDRIKQAKAKDPDLYDQLLSVIPMTKFAEIEDIVYAALFLLSAKADMITGVTLPVDGGLTAC